MKVGLSIRTFTPRSGGLQAHAAQLAKYLQQLGHEVRVVTRTVSKSPTWQDLFMYSDPSTADEVDGVPVRLLRPPAGSRLRLRVSMKCCGRPALRPFGIKLYNHFFARPALEALRGVDLVHHVGQGSEMIGFAAQDAAQKLGVPFVVQPTVHPGQWGDSEIDFDLYRRAVRLLVHTVYEARYFENKQVGVPIDVVGNGIEDRADGNAARFRERHGLRGPIVLFLGRRDPDKGYPLVKAAFARGRNEYAGATLVCMGPGPVQPDATAVAPSPGILELGAVTEEEKHDALAACTCLCVPSEGESFGLVYMEAGRYSKPVICRRLPVLLELLGPRNAALFVGSEPDASGRSELTEAALSDAIKRLLGDAQLREEIGRNCRRVSEDFIWPQIVRRFEGAYQAALKRPVAAANP